MTAPTDDRHGPELLPGVSRATAIDLVTRMRDLYADAETRIAADIARRLASGMDSPTWAADKLAQIGQLRKFTEVTLRRLKRDTTREVTYTLVSAYMRGGEEATKTLVRLGLKLKATPDDALRKALAGPASKLSKALDDIGRAFPNVAALMRVAASLALRINGTHLPVLRWALDAYREVIAGGALHSVLTGIATRRRASQVAWENLLSEGITGFTDKAGRHWNLATYVEMATRTGAAQAAIEGHLDRLESAGLDYVIVSNAPQECIKCRPWEGKILARTGVEGPRAVKMLHAIEDKRVTVHIAGTVAEAILAGLLHPNCRHSLSAYLPGVTRIPTNTADPEGDAARTRLRELERRVRKEKLKAVAAIDPAARREHERKAREWQAEIRKHVAATAHLGIFRKPERERINLGNGPHGTRVVTPAPTPKPKAQPKAKPTPAKPKATKPAEVDTYTERPVTKRDFEIRELEQKIATSAKDRAEYIKSWEDGIRRLGPNPDPKDLAYYQRGLEHAKTLPERLRQELADLLAAKDPDLDKPLPGRFVRTGTPSVAHAQAHVRDRVDARIPDTQRIKIQAELGRQAGMAPRTAMMLGHVTMPKPGSAAAYDFEQENPGSNAYYRWAGANPDQLRAIVFNPRWISDHAAMEAAGRACNKSGWWTPSGVTNSLAGTTAHEYGHHVTASIFDMASFRYDADRGRRLIAVIATSLNVVANPNSPSIWTELNRIVTDNKAWITRHVSEYGSKNAAEFLAEVWQEWSTMGDKARPHIREIGKVMQELAEEGAFD